MDIKDNALAFEAVKVAMHQTKDGIKITLVIHPNDIPQGLFSDPVGQRYQVAMVGLSDDGTPTKRDPLAKQKAEVVRMAGVLCKNPKFQTWVSEHSFFQATEEGAAEFIRDRCNVKSRADIPNDMTALNTFNMIRLRFSETVRSDEPTAS